MNTFLSLQRKHIRSETAHKQRNKARACATIFPTINTPYPNEQVKLTEGDYTNLKLTTPEDLVVAAQILEARRINEFENGGGFDDDEEDGDGKESISMIRADEKWTDEPRPIGNSADEKKESISAIRANEQWIEPRSESGSADSYDEPMVNLSKLRADMQS